MRTLRLSLLATITLTLFGGLGGVALAEDASDASPEASAPPPELALVKGLTGSCAEGQLSLQSGGGVVLKHQPFTCRNSANDPRVSGPASGETRSACWSGNRCIHWGTLQIAGPDGTWIGPWTGTDSKIVPRMSLVTLEGTGAYEGWSFIAHLGGRGEDASTIEFSGLIYPGPLPPWDASLPPVPAD